MKSLGYLLITAGFLAAAYFAVRDAKAVALAPFLASIAVGALGVTVVRVIQHRESHHEEKLVENVGVLQGALGRLSENADRLEHEKAAIDVYDLRHTIEKVFAADIDAFVEARESIAHRFGLPAYAEVMSHFAAGERNLNRVWSASTDGYIDEAHAYVTLAMEQFREANEAFERILARA